MQSIEDRDGPKRSRRTLRDLRGSNLVDAIVFRLWRDIVRARHWVVASCGYVKRV